MTIEIVGDGLASSSADAVALGGIVTGSVPGELVQVSIPAVVVDDLAGDVSVDGGTLRRPLVANRPVRFESGRFESGRFESGRFGGMELGAVAGQNIAVVQAAPWHAAGITGAVKVGIIDFFDLGRWNPTEHGAVPDAAHLFCLDTSGSGYCDGAGSTGDEHGVAVAEVVKDMAPSAELFLATAGTVSDLRTAIDWFAANGVQIVTRSLGAAYDGPGDGTGPLAAVVDLAASKGITWFNSAGNDAAGSYGRYTDGVDPSGYLDFLNGPGVDTTLRISASSEGCVGLDGIRWSDWYLPAPQMSDYAIEVYNASGTLLLETTDARQSLGAVPLEAPDYYRCVGALTLKIRRVTTGGDPTADVVEVGLFEGSLEHSQTTYSAAKPVVDSKSPALVAVGAVDPALGTAIGFYSSQGPTNDGRIKPDMSAPSCIRSSIYATSCFNGTSAASPSAAGMAALLLSRGLATSGAALAALTKHLVVDLGTPGADNVFGTGRAMLPPVPAALDVRPTAYTPLITPSRLLDTRPTTPSANARVGPHPPFTIIDLPVGIAGATAVAVSVVSTDSLEPGYLQALPTLMGTIGASSTLNVATPGEIQPNFAVVPVGADNRISLYLFAGGNVIVDLLGSFAPAGDAPVGAGRFVALDPVRVLDTRPGTGGPVPPEWTPHRPAIGETVRVPGITAGAAAAVVNVTVDAAAGPGFVRTQPTGATGLTTSNGNFVSGVASSTLSIVPVGSDGTISVLTSNSAHLVVDLMGYITSVVAPASRVGLFVPRTPTRIFDTRGGNGPVVSSLTDRDVAVVGSAAAVPAGATGVSFNVTSDAAVGAGFATLHPQDAARPLISNLNHPVGSPRANAAMVRLAPAGGLKVFVNQTTHVIIDVNGYFTGPT